MRPAVFVGSSSEGLPVAQALQVLLDRSAECELWSQGTFGLGSGTLESLVSALPRFDFAVLVVDADDTAVSRGDNKNVPRDNVLFELGLFMGALGRERTFMVHDRSRRPDLPSDLAGVTAATYQPHASGNAQAALGAASTMIATQIDRLGLSDARRSPAAQAPAADGFPRISELIDIYQRYAICEESPAHMDMKYHRRQVLRGNAAEGLSKQPLVWTKPSDKLPPFDSTNPPAIELRSATRTGPGSAKLVTPRKKSATSFTVDLKLEPPLRMHETVDFSADGTFGKYRFLRAADLREATREGPVGERDFDYLSWTINHPTHELNLVVDLPAAVGIEALGPRSSFHDDDFPVGSEPNVALNEEYEFTDVTELDSKFIRMRLKVREPKLRCRYRLAWRLP